MRYMVDYFVQRWDFQRTHHVRANVALGEFLDHCTNGITVSEAWEKVQLYYPQAPVPKEDYLEEDDTVLAQRGAVAEMVLGLLERPILEDETVLAQRGAVAEMVLGLPLPSDGWQLQG